MHSARSSKTEIRNESAAAMRRRLRATWPRYRAYERGIVLQFIRPGKPTENAYCESFNGKLRDECLNTIWFTSLGADASVMTNVMGSFPLAG
jgi:transposase InsO family protein